MRSIAHWTPRYVANRLRLMAWERIHPDQPWLTQDAIHLLEQLLRPADVGLETGSGRSTRWFASRTAHLTSVEHDAAWHAIVAQQLARAGISSKVTYSLCPDGAGERPDSRYVGAIAALGDRSLDYALIDGAPAITARWRRSRSSRRGAAHHRQRELVSPAPAPLGRAAFPRGIGWLPDQGVGGRGPPHQRLAAPLDLERRHRHVPPLRPLTDAALSSC